MKNLIFVIILAFSVDIANAIWQPTNGPFGGIINCLAASGTNIFAGTDGGIFLSTNNGSNWVSANNGLTTNAVNSIIIKDTNIFAGTYSGVFLSTNNGSSWTDVNTGLSQYTVVTSFALSGTNIFAGTYDGVFLSTNNGSNWASVTDNFENYGVQALAVSNAYIFAGVYSGGVWKRQLSDFFGFIESDNENFNYKVYPNPNNGKFKIEMDINTSDYINLEIYSIFGEKIYTISHLKQSSNEIDLTGFSKGIYFVKIFDGEKVYTEKIVKQ